MLIFNNKEKVYRVLIFSIIFLIILSVIELFIEKKVHFAIERIPMFYGIFGFLCAFLIIVITLLAKKIGLTKKEDYYD